MNLKEGALLHNNTYRIERVLGQGGFGITYLAVHVRLKKKVAIKEFFPKAFCDRDADTSHVRTASKANSVTVEKLKNKFIKEAEHIAEMDSPYIVRIIDVFEENHTAYYIMDYIDGRSLSDIVKNDGPLSVDQAVEYITKIGEALTYIHSKLMNHLDVKPANIMVRSKDNTPILIDFGLSKQYDSEGNQTSTTPVGISHGYAPLEQYNDGGVKEFSPQTDLYSLAATLYYILSGVTPPQATKLIEDDLTFPVTIPAELIGSISKAMSSRRTNRYSSIADFIHSFSSVTNYDDLTELSENSLQMINDHECIDLGLPSRTKWATCNIGASKPEERGEYFAWGETETKERFDDNNYKLCEISKVEASSQKGFFSKLFNSNKKNCVTWLKKDYDKIPNLSGNENDAAHKIWGAYWKTPTVENWKELLNYCSWTFISESSRCGYEVVGQNGNKIFLPIGQKRDWMQATESKNGNYWSSNSSKNDMCYAFCLEFDENGRQIIQNFKEDGLLIRPVFCGY